jgi:hypothetical protein
LFLPLKTASKKFGAVLLLRGPDFPGDQVLVRFRNMYIRELNQQRKSTLPFVFAVRQISGEVLPMS